MNIREISKPVTAKSLNESLARRFGQKVKLENFTLEQLQDTRNKLRTKLSQVETNESFDQVSNGETYQKNKLFLDVLNAEISERENTDESLVGAIAGTDTGKDIAQAIDNRPTKELYRKGMSGLAELLKQAMDMAAKVGGAEGYEQVLKRIVQDLETKTTTSESIVREGAEDEAELVMAAKDMVDRVTGWMEDTAEMQTESMLELADAIRDEMGQVQSEQFVATVKPALEGLYTAMESTRGALTQGVGMLTGEGEAPQTMGADEEMPAGGDEMEPTVDAEAAPEDDGMGASEPAAGGTEPAGRARRESKQYNKKQIAERSRKLATVLSKKK